MRKGKVTEFCEPGFVSEGFVLSKGRKRKLPLWVQGELLDQGKKFYPKNHECMCLENISDSH